MGQCGRKHETVAKGWGYRVDSMGLLSRMQGTFEEKAWDYG